LVFPVTRETNLEGRRHIFVHIPPVLGKYYGIRLTTLTINLEPTT
jgi:hypothetical protein